MQPSNSRMLTRIFHVGGANHGRAQAEERDRVTSTSEQPNDNAAQGTTAQPSSNNSNSTPTSDDDEEAIIRQRLLELTGPPAFAVSRKAVVTLVLLPLIPLIFLVILVVPTVVPSVSMAGMLSFLKSLLLPALFAALLYALLTYLLIPLYRRHRQRYSQYLPVSTLSSTFSTSTQSLRQRIQDALTSFFMPSRWAEWRYRRRSGRRSRVVDASDGERVRDEEMGDISEDSDSEEELRSGLPRDSVTDRRRDAYERGAGARESASDRRLSRELEEGFRDSSDEEDEPRR